MQRLFPGIEGVFGYIRDANLGTHILSTKNGDGICSILRHNGLEADSIIGKEYGKKRDEQLKNAEENGIVLRNPVAVDDSSENLRILADVIGGDRVIAAKYGYDIPERLQGFKHVVNIPAEITDVLKGIYGLV